MTTSPEPPARPNRRWYQFGLRGLLIGVTVLAPLLGIVGFIARMPVRRAVPSNPDLYYELDAKGAVARCNYGSAVGALTPGMWKGLVLSNAETTGEELTRISGGQLLYLSIEGRSATADVIQAAAAMKSLKALEITDGPESIEAFLPLQDNDTLEELTLVGEHLEDSHLTIAATIKRLKILRYQWRPDTTTTTQKGYEEFRRRRPDVEIGLMAY